LVIILPSDCGFVQYVLQLTLTVLLSLSLFYLSTYLPLDAPQARLLTNQIKTAQH